MKRIRVKSRMFKFPYEEGKDYPVEVDIPDDAEICGYQSGVVGGNAIIQVVWSEVAGYYQDLIIDPNVNTSNLGLMRENAALNEELGERLEEDDAELLKLEERMEEANPCSGKKKKKQKKTKA